MWVVLAAAVAFDVRYINLDQRQDRQRLMAQELKAQNVSAVRIRAHDAQSKVRSERGAACAKSHIDALKSVSNKVGLIIEDDATFKRKLPKAELEQPSFTWDVLLLAYNGKYNESDCVGKAWCRALDMQTTSMYAARLEYIPMLVASWRKAYVGLQQGNRTVSTLGIRHGRACSESRGTIGTRQSRESPSRGRVTAA